MMYTDYFADEANNPYHGVPISVYKDNTIVMVNWAPIQPQEIINTISKNPHPDAYVGFSEQGPTVCSFVLFHLHKVPKTRVATRSIFEGIPSQILRTSQASDLPTPTYSWRLSAWRQS